MDKKKKVIDLSFLEPVYTPVELPSRGMLYKDDSILKSGILNCRAMKTSEEKLIDKIDKYNYYSILDQIISNCTQEPIQVGKLTVGDRFYLLCWIRAHSYGPEYNIDLECPLCGHKYEGNINLDKFDPVFLEDDIREPIELELPVSKIKVKIIIPRSELYKKSLSRTFAEEKIMSKNKNKNKKNDNDEKLYLKALSVKEMILPNADNTVLTAEEDFDMIFDIISNKLDAYDSVTFNIKWDMYDHGLIEPYMETCPNCEGVYEQYPLLSSYFFHPNTKQ